MDYQDFLSKITDSGLKIGEINDYYGQADDIKEKLFHDVKTEKKNKFTGEKIESVANFDFIGEMWSTGGLEGGNCWHSNEPKEYSCDNEPKTFAALDKILNVIAPNITYLQYKGLQVSNDIVYEERAYQYEYYGNRSDYVYRYVKLKELFDYLVENKLI